MTRLARFRTLVGIFLEPCIAALFVGIFAAVPGALPPPPDATSCGKLTRRAWNLTSS